MYSSEGNCSMKAQSNVKGRIKWYVKKSLSSCTEDSILLFLNIDFRCCEHVSIMEVGNTRTLGGGDLPEDLPIFLYRYNKDNRRDGRREKEREGKKHLVCHNKIKSKLCCCCFVRLKSPHTSNKLKSLRNPGKSSNFSSLLPYQLSILLIRFIYTFVYMYAPFVVPLR